MNRVLHIAKGLSLPLELVTESFSILAKKRVGKSFTARRIMEQLFKAALQVVIVDPKGDWWGIQSAADGKGPGLSILIFGGEHGDVPLEPGSGELVAKLVVEQRVSVLLDLSLFSKGQVATFMAAFLETFFRLKALEKNRTPVMLFVDEADAIAPQTPGPSELRMLGAISDVVRKGGQRGIGCGLATQRAALLNKSVLTQTQLLILLRTTSPQDRDAVKEWVKAHGTKEQFDELSESLASLPKGDAWFWSPGWPTDEGIFQRAHVLPIETFDSGATPKIGETRIEPKKRADVDVEAIRKEMAETIERAKENDPRELKREIATLRGQLSRSGGQWESVAKEAQAELERVKKTKAAPAPKVEVRERLVLKDSQVERLETLGARAEKAIEAFVVAAREIRPAMLRAIEATRNVQPITVQAALAKPERQFSAPSPRPALNRPVVATRAPTADDWHVSGVEQRILNTIAGMAALGVEEPDKATVAALVGYHPNAKSYSNAVSHLRTSDRIRYAAGGRIALTDAGRAIAESNLPVTSRAELHALWFERLGGVAEKILRPVLAAYPQPVAIDEVAAAAGYHPNAKSFSNMKSRLRTLGLIDYPMAGQLVATHVLFPEALL